MKAMAKGLMLVFLAPLTLLAFDQKERAALRQLAGTVESEIRSVSVLDGKAITVLPVKGDQEGYFEGLLIQALTRAGKTCVTANDEEKDARFKRILSEIKWDERQAILRSVDPATIDTLGELKSTQILLESAVEIVKNGPKETVAELNLLAYAIKTKQYVWGANVIDGKFAPIKTIGETAQGMADPSRIRVAVRCEKGNAAVVIDDAASAIRNALAKAGYVVDSPFPPDVEVTVSASREVFDRTGEWYKLTGSLSLKTRILGGNPRTLAEKTVTKSGARGLGEAAAEKNLANALTAEAGEWVKASFTPEQVGLKVSTVELKLREKVVSADELKLQAEFCQTVNAEKGVRSARLIRQDAKTGTFTFRIVFDAEQFSDGFLNTLMVKHPEWDLGYVK